MALLTVVFQLVRDSQTRMQESSGLMVDALELEEQVSMQYCYIDEFTTKLHVFIPIMN